MRRARAGGDDHRIGRQRRARLRARVVAEVDVDAAARALGGAPVGEVGELAASRQVAARGGSCRRARAARSSRVTRWPRAAATQAASRPAGPPPITTTCFDARRRRQRAEAELGVASDRRVGDAGDRQTERQVAVAALVAAGAAADRRRSRRARPSPATRDRRSARAPRSRRRHRRGSRMASASSGVRMRCTANTGVARTAAFTARAAYDAAGVRHVQRPHHADAGDADADVEEIDQAALPRAAARDLGGVVGGRGPPAPCSSSPTRRRPTAIAGPTTARTAAEHLDGEAHAILEAAAVARRCAGCCAARGTRGSDSRARACSSMPSKPPAAACCAPSARSRSITSAMSAASIGLRRFERVGHRRRRPRRQLRPRALVDAAVVRELQEGERAVRVHRDRSGVRKCGTASGPPGAGVVVHLVRRGRMHLRLAGDDHAGAAARTVGEIASEPLAEVTRFAEDRRRLRRTS